MGDWFHTHAHSHYSFKDALPSVQDMVDLDLSYAPPLSPLWDPVLVAARQAASAAV